MSDAKQTCLIISRIPRRLHRAFVADQAAAIGIGEQLGDLYFLAIYFERIADQPDAVAVVDVPVPMHDRERLDRLAVELPPAVDREPLRLLENSRREDDVFLDADGEQTERLVAALLFDDLVMLGERGDGFTGLCHRVWSELQFGVLIDGIDHFACRQDAVEAIGNLLSGLRRHRHADEIVIAADGQVVGHHLHRSGDFAFAAAGVESPLISTVLNVRRKLGKLPLVIS